MAGASSLWKAARASAIGFSTLEDDGSVGMMIIIARSEEYYAIETRGYSLAAVYKNDYYDHNGLK